MKIGITLEIFPLIKFDFHYSRKYNSNLIETIIHRTAASGRRGCQGADCSHICLATDDDGGFACSCPFGTGLALGSDRRTCGFPPTCKPDEFTCTSAAGIQCYQMAKFDPFLSLDCARVEGVGAQSNFAA